MNFFGKGSTQEEKARTVLNETSASKLGSGSEVDRYEAHFADGVDRMRNAALNYQGVGAEQDRYGAHFSLDQAKVWAAAQSILNAKGAGAEQDRHESHFGLGADGLARARAIANARGVGAEQVRMPRPY
jgi:hypothetical protein